MADRDLVTETRELLAAATRGPWRTGREDRTCGYITYAIIPPNEGATVAWVPEDCNDNARRDAALIAAALRLLAALADEVERMREALLDFESWADECVGKRGGMGGGLHAWPPIPPSAARLMRRSARAALRKDDDS